MRNLKRVLALAMAMIMMLGMMVIGTSAASYKDAETIDANYAEAIEILTNMGVFKGQSATESVFAPKAVLTRAEAAALIYRVITGDVTDAQKANYDYASLKDVKAGEWYTSYVTYANNGGYIKGDENGNFNPKADVTGVQVLAIMLRAAGYGQNGEYEGKAWKDNILTDAYELGIIGGISTATLNAPATRELVAQLLFNAMSEVQMVSYTPLLGYFGYGKTTLGEKVFGLKKVTGVITANEKADLYSAKALAAGKTALDKDTKNLYNLSTDETIIGEKVSFWACKNTAVSTPKSLAKVTDWSNMALNAAQKQAIAKATDAETLVLNNYEAAKNYAYGLGVKVKGIDNDNDGMYEYILTETKTLTTVKYISTSGNITLANYESMAAQDAYTGIAKDDTVLAISYDGATHIEKAEFITGIVSGVKHTAVTANDTAVINNEQYKVSALDTVANAPIYSFDTVNDTYQPGADWNGATYFYFLDNYGNIIAYTLADELDTAYGLILDYDVYKTGAFQGDLTWRPTDGISFGDLYVKYLTVNNEVQTAKVDVDFVKYFHEANTGYVDFNILPGDVVSYRIDEDGEFVLVYTYETYDPDDTTVSINAKNDVATVFTSDNSNKYTETYSVTEDLVVFYYISRDAIDGSGARFGLGTVIGASTPVYGVLTGADAIVDLADAEALYQIDAVEGKNNHLSKNGAVYMLNVRAHINSFVDYCYVPSWKNVSSYKLNGQYYWEYKAIGSDGKAIDVVTTKPYNEYETPVWAYHTLNVNGVQINELLPAEMNDARVMFGDIHDTVNGKSFFIFETDGWEGENFDDPAMFVDVATGSAAELSVAYCSTGYIVVESVGSKYVVKAAFITETVEDEPLYVDTTVTLPKGTDEEKHLPIGFAFNKDLLGTGKFLVKIDGKYVTDKTGANVIYEVKETASNLVVTAAWDEANVVIEAYEAPVPNKALNMLATARLNGELLDNAKGFETLDAAIAGATKINLPEVAEKYELTITTKDVGTGTGAYGAIDWATTKTAAANITFASYDAFSDATELTGIGTGSYIVIALEVFGDVAYYAYVIG